MRFAITIEQARILPDIFYNNLSKNIGDTIRKNVKTKAMKAATRMEPRPVVYIRVEDRIPQYSIVTIELLYYPLELKLHEASYAQYAKRWTISGNGEEEGKIDPAKHQRMMHKADDLCLGC